MISRPRQKQDWDNLISSTNKKSAWSLAHDTPGCLNHIDPSRTAADMTATTSSAHQCKGQTTRAAAPRVGKGSVSTGVVEAEAGMVGDETALPFDLADVE